MAAQDMRDDRTFHINLHIGISRGQLRAAAALVAVCLCARDIEPETLTMTTSYPAPSGVYMGIVTTGGSLSSPVNTLLARDTGNVGVGTTSPASPAPNGATGGNVDSNDVYLRSVGKWASVLGYGGPIGTIVGWHKSFPNTPALPSGWVECNGQVLNDPASPYNGQTIPNLNNTPPGYVGGGRFLRGGTTSGYLQDGTELMLLASDGSGLGLYFPLYGYYNGTPNYDGYSGSLPMGIYSPANLSNTGWWASPTLRGRPVNMSIVWIMRVK